MKLFDLHFLMLLNRVIWLNVVDAKGVAAELFIGVRTAWSNSCSNCGLKSCI